jgi:hypothetical protein
MPNADAPHLDFKMWAYLDEASRKIEENGRTGCPPAVFQTVDCLSFGTKTAVSLLASIRINGRTELHPFGTTLGYLIDPQAATGQM